MPTCLITGASRGIGFEFVKQYAAEGWTVIAACRSPDQSALRQVVGDVRIELLDVSDFARVEALGKKMEGVPIDLLINNAGIYGPRIVPFELRRLRRLDGSISRKYDGLSQGQRDLFPQRRPQPAKDYCRYHKSDEQY